MKVDEDAVAVAVAVSELVTNAVEYGEPPIRLRVRQRPSSVVIEVDDDGDVFERAVVGRWPGRRGLEMVAALSLAWGIEPLDKGKRAWCEFAASAEPPPAPRPHIDGQP